MTGLLSGKFALITGGSSGIGRAIALRYAEEGAAAVVIADLREDPREGGTPTAELVQSRGTRSVFVRTDVSKAQDMDAALGTAVGLGGLDVFVNCAGLYFEEDGNFLDVSEEDFQRVFDVNVKGVFLGMQRAGRVMKDKGGGSIINFSSTAGIRGRGHCSVYCGAKGAVRTMSNAVGDLLGPYGIRVNVLHPGAIDTAMSRDDAQNVGSAATRKPHGGQVIPLRRVGNPREVADVAVFLASDLSSFVTATSLVVDGGAMAY